MKRPLFIQIITLVSFFSLISLFVAYRGGYFTSDPGSDEAPLQTSHNGGALTNTARKDTFPEGMDSSSFILMASSKSMVLIDQSKSAVTDTANRFKTKATPPPDPSTFLSSSKSTAIFDSNLFRFKVPHITFYYPAKKPRQKKKRQ